MGDWPVKINLDVKVSVETADKLAGVLIDIISPASQTAGLAGDYIAHRRKVLSVIFEKGLEKARNSGNPISPPPPKFLLEFADKASREDMESELIDLWASLLAESATSHKSVLISFIDILSRIGSVEASLLQALSYVPETYKWGEFEATKSGYLEALIAGPLTNVAFGGFAVGLDFMESGTDAPIIPVSVEYTGDVATTADESQKGWDTDIKFSEQYEQNVVAWEILVKQSVIRQVRVSHDVESCRVGFSFLELTPLGFELLRTLNN